MLKGIKSAIDKVVLISEVVKSRVKGIHQILEIGCLNNEDIFYNDDYISKIIPKISVTLSNFEPKNKDLGYRAPYSLTDLYKLNTVVSKHILKSKINYNESIINQNFNKNKESIKKENVIKDNDIGVIRKDKIPYYNHKIIEFPNDQIHYKSLLKSIAFRIDNIKKRIFLIESTSNVNINREKGEMKNLNSDENNDYYFTTIIQIIRNNINILNNSEFMIKKIFEISLCVNLIKKVLFQFNNFVNKFENLYLLIDKDMSYINFNKCNSLNSFKEEIKINELKFNETCFILNKIEILFQRFLKKLDGFHKIKSCLLLSINIKKYNRR